MIDLVIMFGSIFVFACGVSAGYEAFLLVCNFVWSLECVCNILLHIATAYYVIHLSVDMMRTSTYE